MAENSNMQKIKCLHIVIKRDGIAIEDNLSPAPPNWKNYVKKHLNMPGLDGGKMFRLLTDEKVDYPMNGMHVYINVEDVELDTSDEQSSPEPSLEDEKSKVLETEQPTKSNIILLNEK